MSQKLSQCSALERSEKDQPPNSCQVERPANSDVGRRNKAQSAQRNGETTTSSSPESGSLNGEGKQAGKSRRRRKRSSNPGSGPGEGRADAQTLNEAKPQQAADARAELSGLKFECANVWFERGVYERAESLYQRWLASSSGGTTQSAKAPSAPGRNSKVPPSSGPASTWVNKTSFDHAGGQFVESLAPVPNSLNIPARPGSSSVARTPDEGYQSLTPTPVQQAVVAPTSRQSVNGLPRIPAELLRDVWLEKPLYDRAEAVFYQNLYGNNSSKRSSCAPTSRSNDHPQSLVEEEEEEEEDQVAGEEKWVVPQGKAEVFHALLPIQEEEEPNEVPEKEEVARGGVGYFLHPDSEPVWLDKWRFQAAESRFHSVSGTEAAAGKKKKNPRPASSSSTPPRDKYDQTGGVDLLQMFHLHHFLSFASSMNVCGKNIFSFGLSCR